MNLFYQPELLQGVHHLSPEESRHAVKVLRMQNGDTLDVTDGQGTFYHTRITDANASQCEFEIISTRKIPRRSFEIAIAIAPTKNIDRIEWFVEKAVEVGIEKIIFMECKNSERHHLNHERMMKIVVSAMKQSAQAWLPEVTTLMPFRDVLKLQAEQKFICHATDESPKMLFISAKKHSSYLVLIGPEGDFAQTEIDDAVSSGFEMVSLGPTRLRTETAALTAFQFLNFINL